jgi:hypothetical protein
VKFAAAVAAAASAQPHARPDTVAGRTLLADGDGLAYYCAGNDNTSSGVARRNLETKIEAAMKASGCDKVVILATSAASHKGHRYAISRLKPYQGKRSHSRRPKNWQFMRELIERDPRAVVTDTLEADDLFHINSVRLGHENVAILTEDKDMRIVPGIHVNWETHAVVRVEPDTWAFDVDDKTFGRKWFWLQMCEGDGVDNVMGLNGCYLDDKFHKQCGPARARQLLKHVRNEADAMEVVFHQHQLVYGGTSELDAYVAFIENACLLWMRRTDRLFDCMDAGGPLEHMPQGLAAAARRVIRDRVEDI